MDNSKAKKERRFKEAMVNLDILTALFKGSMGVKIGNDLPHDVEVDRVYYDLSHCCLMVTLVSERFDPVPEGELPPRVVESRVFGVERVERC